MPIDLLSIAYLLLLLLLLLGGWVVTISTTMVGAVPNVANS